MLPTAKLFTELDWDEAMRFEPPEPNRESTGMSAYNAATSRVQVGTDKDLGALSVHSCFGLAIRFALRRGSAEQRFFETLNERLVGAMAASTEAWFGKHLREADVRSMFVPSTLVDRRGRASAMMTTSDKTRVYVHDEEGGGMRRGLVGDLRRAERMPCCLVYSLDGLWIEEEKWGARLRVTDVLLFPALARDDSDSDASSSSSARSIETEVRRRFRLEGGSTGSSRRAEITNDEELFRRLRPAPLHDADDFDEEESSFHSRMPFGQPAERRRRMRRGTPPAAAGDDAELDFELDLRSDDENDDGEQPPV